MEEVLERYEQAYDLARPVLCMDEQPIQLTGETRTPLDTPQDHPQRVDYDYDRLVTASIFMFAEPLSGFGQTSARERRTQLAWAQEVTRLLDTRYVDSERATLVCDNLNTHTKGTFYEVFEPERPAHW